MQIFSLLAVSFFGRLQGATQWEGTNANLPAIVRHLYLRVLQIGAAQASMIQIHTL